MVGEEIYSVMLVRYGWMDSVVCGDGGGGGCKGGSLLFWWCWWDVVILGIFEGDEGGLVMCRRWLLDE